jgi:hypothetical protein
MPRACTLLALAAALLTGCGGSDRDGDVEAAVERFNRAFESRDAQDACGELTEGAQSELEKSEKKPCEEAILGLELTPSPVTRVEVHVTSAVADLRGGGSAFLDSTPDGWKISALGCKPLPGDQPYDCELAT